VGREGECHTIRGTFEYPIRGARYASCRPRTFHHAADEVAVLRVEIRGLVRLRHRGQPVLEDPGDSENGPRCSLRRGEETGRKNLLKDWTHRDAGLDATTRRWQDNNTLLITRTPGYGITRVDITWRRRRDSRGRISMTSCRLDTRRSIPPNDLSIHRGRETWRKEDTMLLPRCGGGI